MTNAPSTPSDPPCPKCGARSVTFVEISGPASLPQAHAQAQAEALPRIQEDAQAKRNNLEKYHQLELAKVDRWIELQVIALNERCQLELKQVESTIAQRRKQELTSTNHPLDAVYGKPEEVRRRALRTVKDKRKQWSDEIRAEAATKRAQIAANLAADQLRIEQEAQAASARLKV